MKGNLRHNPENRVATLVRIPDITNPAILAFTLKTTREYFADAAWSQPPLPDDLVSIIPSTMHITSEEGERGELIGRIQFIRSNEEIFFDEKWVIRESYLKKQ